MPKIKVVDSIMGSGKTTLIKSIIEKEYNDNTIYPKNKYIFITPQLRDIETSLTLDDEEDNEILDGFIHDVKIANFKQPLNRGNGKLDSLHKLLINENNICCTHALFKMFTYETMELIKLNDYIVIIDEVVDLTEQLDIYLSDYENLIETNTISVNDATKEITWLDSEYNGAFNHLKKMCENDLVIESSTKESKTSTGKGVQLLVWNFNPSIMKELKEVYILTYLFEGSYMYYYLQAHNIDYTKFSIQDGELILYSDKKPYDMSHIRSLINLYDGKLNDIGTNRNNTALSVSWFKNNKALVEQLKKNMINYKKQIIKAESNDIIWTTFKEFSNKLKGSGLSLPNRKNNGNFISCNEKGTNLYKDKTTVLYCCNRYFHPDDYRYFNNLGVTVNTDIWALSDMIQFIWRSAIRDSKKINLYIPSYRMRELLLRWLNGKYE